MKNIKLPSEVKLKVISYLQYTYTALEHQNELKDFFENISPSLREEVKKFIFFSALKKNLIFSMNQSVKDFLITKIDLVMCPPEEIKVQ